MQYICDHLDPFNEECNCAEFYELNLSTTQPVAAFQYSALSLAEARSFRLEHKDLDLVSEPEKVWLGYSPEQRDWDSDELVHFEPVTGFPEPSSEDFFKEEDPYVPELPSTSYRDLKPNEVTLTLDGAKPNPRAIKDPQPLDYSTVVPFPRNFRPHTFTQPLTEEHFFFHNEHLTELTHFRTYLNVFTGSYDGLLHMGPLAFTTYNDRVAVYCTTKGCHFHRSQNQPFTAPANPTREEQEDFILACIRHSNNHDLRSRRPAKGQFIHAINCDTNHKHYDAKQRPVRCNAYNPQLHPSQLDEHSLHELHYFLKQHLHYCKTPTCKCSHYESLIWDLTHPLAVA